jgi:hypothetical protein
MVRDRHPERAQLLDPPVEDARSDHRAKVRQVRVEDRGSVEQRTPRVEDDAVLAPARLEHRTDVRIRVLGFDQRDERHWSPAVG